MDYQGRVCGVDAGVGNKPAAYVIDREGTMVCIDKCPTSTDETGIALAYASPLDYKEKGIDGLYGADLLICKDDYTKESVAKIVGSGDDFGVATDCMFSVESTEVLSYCIPSISGLLARREHDNLDDVRERRDELHDGVCRRHLHGQGLDLRLRLRGRAPRRLPLHLRPPHPGSAVHDRVDGHCPRDDHVPVRRLLHVRHVREVGRGAVAA